MRIGTTEILLILVIALVIFGPQKLPEMAKTLGQTLGGFKKELSSYEEDAAEIKDALKFDATTTKKSSKKKKKKKSSTKKKSSEASEAEESSEAEEETAEDAGSVEEAVEAEASASESSEEA